MELKIYVMSHKETYIPAHPLLRSLQIGTALHAALPGMLHDNTGRNISGKNPYYCELTGQYWAWQNETADYYGFFHYRRYLSFQVDRRPYRIYHFPDKRTLARMGYNANQMRTLIAQYDVIAPMAEEMHETAWENYRRAPYHFIEDLRLAAGLVREMYPDYVPALEWYWGSTRLYLKNMYIMKRDFFVQYCSWLFPLLEEFDRRNDWKKYHGQAVALRVDGYLAERLFGVWYTHLKQTQAVRCCELPRVHFARMDDDKRLSGMRLVNLALPPGTRRRSLVSRGARFVLKRRADRWL